MWRPPAAPTTAATFYTQIYASAATGVPTEGPKKKRPGDSAQSVFGQQLEPSLEANILQKLVRYLHARALYLENIFETQVPKSEVKMLKRKINAEKEGVQLATYVKSPHVVAEILKIFLAKLPEPLLSFEAYDSFLMVLSLEEFQDRISALRKVLHDLPFLLGNARLEVLSLLNRINANKETNKMSADRLAAIFGPIILRPEEDIYYCKEDLPGVIEITKMLIEDFDMLVKAPQGAKKFTYDPIVKRKAPTTQRLRVVKFKAPPPPERSAISDVATQQPAATQATNPASTSSSIPPLTQTSPRNHEEGSVTHWNVRPSEPGSKKDSLSPRGLSIGRAGVPKIEQSTEEPEQHKKGAEGSLTFQPNSSLTVDQNETSEQRKERVLSFLTNRALEMVSGIRNTTDYNQAVLLSRTVRDAKKYLGSKLSTMAVKDYLAKAPRPPTPSSGATSPRPTSPRDFSNQDSLAALQTIVATALEEILDQLHYLRGCGNEVQASDSTTSTPLDVALGLTQLSSSTTAPSPSTSLSSLVPSSTTTPTTNAAP